jgi:type II secretory pathway pseudopilin PulG
MLSFSHLQRTTRLSAPAHGRAFSIVEVMILIAIIGVLSSVALVMIGKQPVVIKDTKLSSDVATLNHLVSAYVMDGGNLNGLTSPQMVLDRLKRARPSDELRRHVGPASGRLVDTRLRALITSAPNANGAQRARWNTQKQRFELTKGTGSAVSEFIVDESLASTNYGTDTARKKSNVSFNGVRGWVWGDSANTDSTSYGTPSGGQGDGTSDLFNPDEVQSTPTPPDDGGGGGTGGGGTGGGGGPGPTTPTRLPQPSFSPWGGSFAYAAFPTSVALSPNGAPAGKAQLQYRKNGGSWSDYSGSPISLNPADTLEARNKSLDAVLYYDSYNTGSSYYRLTTGFTGNSTGTWGNATGGSNLLVNTQNGVDSSTFKHGNTKLDLGNGEYLDAGTENVLTFTRKPFETIVPNTWFALGDLLLLNGTTFYDSEADGVTLSINLNLTDPAQSAVIHVNLGLISTENSSDRTASADIVELRNPNTGFSVDIDGVNYRLELSWATLNPGAGVAQGNKFLVYEGSSAQAELRARFVPNR